MNTALQVGSWVELSNFPNRMKVEAVVNGVLVVRDAQSSGNLCLAHPGGIAKKQSQWSATTAVAHRLGRWFGSSHDALKTAVRAAKAR
jgi:hypothetical protein